MIREAILIHAPGFTPGDQLLMNRNAPSGIAFLLLPPVSAAFLY